MMTRIFRARSLAAIGCLTLLAACDSGDPADRADRYIRSAEQKLEAGKFPAAVIEYKNAIQALPDYAPARLALGEAYLSRYRLLDAEKELVRARELGAAADLVLPLLVRTKVLMNDFSAALALVGTMPEDMRSSPVIAVYHSDALVGQGRYDDARAVLDALETHTPEVLARQAQLGVLNGDRDEARRLVDQALQMDPANFDANLLSGRLELYDGDKEGAIAAFRIAVKTDPFAPQAALGLVALLIETGGTAEAKTILAGTANNGFVSLQSLYLGSLIALQEKDFAAAKAESEKVLSVDPRFRPALLVSGVANSALGNDQAAIASLERFASDGEMPGVASRALAWSNMRLGRSDEALEAMEKSGGLADDMESLRLATAAAIGSGEVGKAAEFLSDMLEKDPGNASLAIGLASLKLSSGDKAGASAVLGSISGSGESATLEEKQRLGFVYLQAGQPEEAGRIAAELRESAPDKAAGYVLGGLTLGASGQPGPAEQMLKMGLEREPSNIGAVTALVGVYRHSGRLADAERVLVSAMKDAPDRAGFMLGLARIKIETGRGDEGEALLRKAVGSNPENIEVGLMLARYLLTTGRAEEALTLAGTALKASPDHLGAMEVQGLSYRAVGRHDEAVQTLERLASLAPTRAEAQFLLARSLGDLGRVDAAIGALRHTLSLDGSRQDARLILARLLLLKNDFQAAIKEIDEFERRAGQTGESQDVRGHIAMRQGKPRDALAPFSAAYDLSPSPVRAVTLSQAQVAAGEMSEAIKTLEAEESPYARLPLAALYEEAGRRDDALAVYDSLLKENPDNPVILNDYAWLLSRTGQDTDRAFGYASKARDMAPKSPAILDTWGVVALALGHTEDAVAAHREAVALAPSIPDLRLNLAKALLEQGEREEAVSLLSSVVTLKDFAGRDEAEKLLNEARR